MCVLRDTYLIEDPAHYEQFEPKAVKTTTKIHELPSQGYPKFVTSHFFCRTCKERTPAHNIKHCDCGMIMCVSCWDEWEVTCPICDNTIG
jgi:hypothetical protein